MSIVDKYSEFIKKQQNDLRHSTVNTIGEAKKMDDEEKEHGVEAERELAAGKSKKKQKDYGVKAEEVEQIDELSKKTLGSYIKKASISAADIAHRGAKKEADRDEVNRFTNRLGMKSSQSQTRDIMNKALGSDQDSIKALADKSGKRHQGINRAADKLTKEDAEQIDEVLGKSASAGEWIHDFVKSKNPKFAGKSKEERKKQALAAYYAKKRED